MVRESRKIAAILAADVVDYSRLMAADEAGTLAALAIRRAHFDTLVGEFDGRVFGSVGDSLMAEFPSAVHAVECAQAVQGAVANENAGIPSGKQMRLRIGVNLGDVIGNDDGVAGDAVNVAARLQALAKPGGVLISGTVYDQVHLKVPARYVDAGTRRVKNIEEPVRIFEVLRPPQGVGGRLRAAIARFASRHAVRVTAIVAAFAAVAALGLFWRDIPVPGAGATLGAMLQPDSAPPPNSIAVLPFLNLTGDPGNDYLGDGLAEELMIRLAKIRDLRVAARRSAFAFKGRQGDVRKIADALGVNYVVEGSVRRQGGTVRVNAALVERATGENRWANAYERPSDDFFSIEQAIGTQIITALELVLVPRAAQAAVAGGQDAVAYDLYLRGLARLRQPRSTESLAGAEQLFEQALAAQPGLARAQAGLCEARVERFQLERLPAHVAAAEEACSRAEALDSSAQEVQMAIGRLRLVTGDVADAVTALRRAQALAPNSPDVLIGLADALADAGESLEAEQEYRRAIAMQPTYAAAHMAYGDYLFSPARAAEAAAAYEQATRLTPADPMAFSNLGASRLLMGDFQGAAAAFERSLALDPGGYAYANLGSVDYYLGRYREAEASYRKAAELTPDDHRPWGNLADAQLYGGRAADAAQTYRRALDLVRNELDVNPQHAVNQAQAAYYASRLGETGLARRHLTAALSGGDDNYYVHYYAALTELGFGDTQTAIAHIKRSRQLGYPEVLLKNAPELGDIRSRI